MESTEKSNRDTEQAGEHPSERIFTETDSVYSVCPRSEADQKAYTAEQKKVADGAYQMIMDNLERHLTIVELAGNLHVSPTQVKVCFRRVHGVPVFTFARERRMEAAAKLLAETNESILEIAGRIGYENGSKFAKAFRDVMGMPPGRYRRMMLLQKEERGCGPD